MEGYFQNSKNEDENKARLNISVTNLAEFKELIRQAEKEADQLQKTVNRLKQFELHIDFETNGMPTLVS